MSLKHKSQSALEYMMTYGWAILVIVIVAAVLYSLGIFSPSSSLSTTITGFSNLGTVNAVCLGGTSFTISMGDSTGYPINVTEINLTSSSGKTTYSPNILIQPNSIQTVTVPSSSLCTSGARYSVSAVISYLEPGQIFPGQYTSTGTVAGTANSFPSSATLYEPLNITNTQNQGTPSPFQQMINVTSGSPGWGDISSSPFGQNVEFFSSTGQILDSWLENYTSTHAIWWVKLTSSIPEGSKQTIYMGFAPTSTNLFNTNNIGEAPQLSLSYGEYDDGANVFNNYWNFAGTNLPSGWVASPNQTYITINNGFSIKFSPYGTSLQYSSTFSPPSILDWYGNYIDNPNRYCGWTILGWYNQSYSAGWAQWQNSPTSWVVYQYGDLSQAASNFYNSTGLIGTSQIFSVYTLPSQIQYSLDYYMQSYTNSVSGPLHTIIFRNGAGCGPTSGTEINISWVRVRTYPPNGVMPSVTFGSVS